ncbi:MAG: molybdopterin molybdotransferase MoeA [Cyclobacteriaceae bacterium]
MKTLEDAQNIVLNQSKSFGIEKVSIEDVCGRVLAEDIVADRDYPPFNRAAMDGVAIRFEDNEQTDFVLVETLFAGQEAKQQIEEGECYRIMTGAAVPDSADVVIRIEDVLIDKKNVKVTIQGSAKWLNIARQGEDAREGSVVLSKGTLVSTVDVTTLASLGYSEVLVAKLPTVTIITTGDEIKGVDQKVLPFQIRDSNSNTLKAFLSNYKINKVNAFRVADDKEKLQQAIEKGLSSDILILTGGVSMGEADFVPELLEKNSVEKLFHKVAIKPGKPIWVGRSSHTIVFGLPGNPLSCQVNFLLFIESFLRESFGLAQKKMIELPITKEKNKRNQLDVFYPSKIVYEKGIEIEPLVFNGSGDIRATIGSDGVILHSAKQEMLSKGDSVSFLKWSI